MTTRFFGVASLLPGRSLRLAASSFLAMVSVGAVAQALDHYVDATALAGTGSGADWTNAFLTLDAALAVAGNNDNIMLAEGLYRPGGTGMRSDTFDVTTRVAIYGGYKGLSGGAAAETAPNKPDGSIFATHISGDINGTRNVPGDDVYHVFTIITNDPFNTVVLDGMRITNGYADGTLANDSMGGGILLMDSRLLISDVSLTDCYALTSGGGVHAGGNSRLEMKKVRVRDNFSNGGGGGICVEGTTGAVFFNLEIRENVAAEYGGGLKFTSTSGGFLVLANSVVLDNHGALGGGGIFMDADTEVRDIINCTIAFNRGKSTGNYGAGIRVESHDFEVRLLNSILHFNPEVLNNDNAYVDTPSMFYVDHSNIANPSASYNMTNEVITSDPQFKNNLSRAVGLKSTSPCLEAGDDWNLPFDFLDVDEDGISALEVLDVDIKVFVLAPSGANLGEREQVTASPVTLFGYDRAPLGRIVDMGAYEERYTLSNP